MSCCKAQEIDEFGNRPFSWCEEIPDLPHVKDAEGNDYCVFHAPSKIKGMDEYEFNELVVNYIDSRRTDAMCIMDGSIFPYDLTLGGGKETHKLPGLSFVESVFEKTFIVYNVTVSGFSFFDNVSFVGDVRFKESVFNCGVSFTRSQFKDFTCFTRINFKSNIHFDDAKFNSSIAFFDVDIGSSFSFSYVDCFSLQINNCTFVGDASFKQSRYQSVCLINDSEFCGNANFSYVIWDSDVDFSASSFKGRSFFSDSIFHGTSLFDTTMFYKEAVFYRVEFRGEAKFRNSITSDKIIFNSVDLSEVPLRFVNIDCFVFSNCIWPREVSHIASKFFSLLRPGHEKYHNILNSILGHQVVKDDLQEDSYGRWLPHNSGYNLAQIYRSLKKIAIEQHDFMQASEWHYNEKEKHRQQVHRACQPFTLTFWYWFFSGYGERPIRAAFWLLALVFLLAAGMVWRGAEWGDAFVTTLQYALYIKPDKYDVTIASVEGKIATILISRIVLPLMAALFGFALRNRYRR